MKKRLIRCLLLLVCFVSLAGTADAQKRAVKKRTTTKKTTKAKTKANVQATAQVVDTAVKAPVPVVSKIDSLPIPTVKKSLRMDDAVDSREIRDRTPLTYEHLRADDAVYRHKIWREIDAREKMNLSFRYSADENNGNQRFISILMKAIQDSAVTVFNPIDDRFTTPMTISEVSKGISGEEVVVPIYDQTGQITGYENKVNPPNLDSFYKFQLKEEVLFDKESSRLFWRILGIAPIKNVYTTQGIFVGTVPLFWVYYPDMRPVFAKYEVYNAKNYGSRMSWEELFESRMFSGRIIKSTLDNPYDVTLANTPGLKDNTIFQLLEGESIKEKIFNYEQDLWSY